MLADDRRKHQAKIAAVEKSLADTLEGKKLTARERENLSTRLESLQAQRRTAAEQAAHEKAQLEKQLTGKVSAAEKTAKEWEGRYKAETVDNALQSAAAKADAFSIDQVVTVLPPLSKVVDVVDEKTGKPTGKHRVEVAFPDVDEDGNKVTRNLSPAKTTKRMKELTALYGNLWKSGVVSGIGSGSGGGTPGTRRPIDPKTLTQEQYMKIRRRTRKPWACGRTRSRSARRSSVVVHRLSLPGRGGPGLVTP